MFNKIALISLLSSSALFLQPVKNKVLPGYQSSKITDLNPDFRDRVENILEDLENEGYTVKVRATYRDSRYQNFIYSISQLTEKYFNRRITSVKGGESRHNRTHKGNPGSCAIDISPEGISLEEEAEFYHRVITLSNNRRLKTGGQFKKTNPVWESYNLGWDPGHVYMTWGSCRG